MQLFSANALVFSKKKNLFNPENMKKTLSKVAHNRPHFFSVLTTSPKSAQISFYVQYEWLPAQLLYNDKKQNKNTSGE